MDKLSHEQRLFLTIVLCLVVALIWPVFFPPEELLPTEENETADTVPAERAASAPERESLETIPSETPRWGDTPPVPTRIGEVLSLDVPNYRELIFAETGAVIHRQVLDGYKLPTGSGTDTKLLPVALVGTDTPTIGHLALTMEEADRSGLAKAVWSGEYLDDAPGARFQLSPQIAELPNGVIITKTYRAREGYESEFEIVVENQSGRTVDFSTATLSLPEADGHARGSFLLHLGPGMGNNHPALSHQEQFLPSAAYGQGADANTAVIDERFWHAFTGGAEIAKGANWVALQNRYFTIIAKPEGYTVDAGFGRGRIGKIDAWVLLPPFELQPGGRKKLAFHIYAGPKETELLTNFDPLLRQIDGMEPHVLPVSIARWMMKLLSWIQSHVGNWGVAIVLLTLLVRTVLFPLAHYQFKSMAKMQRLKPRIEEAQRRFSDDKERLQREMMNVYKDAGVNPVAGCLPLLLQMPILIGLFIALQSAIELRGAPFMLWVVDLSIPDTVARIAGVPLNPLPIAMGITMLIQQRLTPMPTADPAQKQMFTIMTLVMIVLFYNFPSGLSLYWLTQNILSIAQQYYLIRAKEDE